MKKESTKVMCNQYFIAMLQNDVGTNEMKNVVNIKKYIYFNEHLVSNIST